MNNYHLYLYCFCMKVVLPTFILEKRSLLEMFADCMCHPDIFIRRVVYEECIDMILCMVIVCLDMNCSIDIKYM